LLQVVPLIHAPVPHLLLWFAMCRAMTLLTYAVTGEMFPERIIGRANGALSMLHLSAAFVVQLGIGAIVNLWPASTFGHYPPSGYEARSRSCLRSDARRCCGLPIPLSPPVCGLRQPETFK